MTRLENVLAAVARELASIRWALVGGLAVSARAEPRFTRDVDLAVAVTGDGDAEALVHRLQEVGYRVSATVEQEATGRLATVRLEPPGAGSGIVVDLLFASSGIEPEIVAAAEALELVPGLVVPVARVGDLIATKVLARDDVERPQDLMDLRALLRIADANEIALAEERLTLIGRRGFHRGRDLLRALRELLGRDHA